jgi:hypothetical protein
MQFEVVLFAGTGTVIIIILKNELLNKKKLTSHIQLKILKLYIGNIQYILFCT